MTATQKKPKRYYWWRLRKNFFTQITIKKLRRSQNGDTKAIIYLQMVLMTIDNDGYIQYEGVEDDICDEIAIALDEEPEIVKETVEQLKDMGLIEMSEEDYFLPEAKNGIDSETESAQRMRNKRKRDKETSQCDTDVTQSDAVVTQQLQNSDTDVTQSREEKSREEEIREREEESKKEKELEPGLVPNNNRPNDPEEIINLYNDICKSYRPVTDYMRYSKELSTCIGLGYTMNDYRIAFTNAENSDYLKGLTDNKPFQSTLGWLLRHLDDVKNSKYN